MPRFTPYAGVACGLLLGALFFIFYGDTLLQSRTNTAPIATSSLAVVPADVPVSRKSSDSVAQAPVNEAPGAQTAPLQSAPAPARPATAIDVLNTPVVKLRVALVNIICYVRSPGSLRSISGSGVLVSPSGIIITNAHVAQYFLLGDRGVSCTIRMGAPAVERYTASLIYISGDWLRANAQVLTEAAPVGTGEHDFAFLAVTGSATSTASVPTVFSHVPLAAEPPTVGTTVAIASFGAQYLNFKQIQNALFPTVVLDTVKDVYTFATDSIDILGFKESSAAQEGSSGGGVVNARTELVGLLTTSDMGNTGGTSDVLRAITASYIRRDYERDTGRSLDTLLTESPSVAVAEYAPKLPDLEAIIAAHLP